MDLEEPLPEALRGKFDVVFNHTVLEHVFDCQLAFRNMAQMSRDILITVVPFCQNQHEMESFKDYWRFSASALRLMYQKQGMTVIYEAGSGHVGSANYLFFVGSRRPQVYIGKLPDWEPVEKQSRWIGRRRWCGFLSYLWIDKWSDLPDTGKYQWPPAPMR